MLQFIPGFYAKVRIDDEGHIVDVADLEAEDLPKHSHSLQDLINESALEDKIAEILSTFFANDGNSAVIFTYDKNTKTVSADVNIDEETVKKNEYGQLALGVDVQSISTNSGSSSSGDSSSSSDSSDSSESGTSHSGSTTTVISSVSEADINLIKEQLQTLRNDIPGIFEKLMSTTFASSGETAVDFTWDKITKTVSAEVNIDGISIQKDENGDLVATGAVVGSGETGNCASHTHLSSQIEDFEKAVVNIFNDYSKNLNIDFTNLIDNTTIKFNEYGQLTAVRTATEKHQHSIKDIYDYEAAEVATKQMMSTLGEDVDLKDGVIDFTKLNIGYAILALNKYIHDVTDKNVTDLKKRLDNLDFKKDSTGQTLLTVCSTAIKNLLLDTAKNTIREVYYGPSVYLSLDNLPYKEGEIRLLKNGTVVSTASIETLGNRFGILDSFSKNDFTAKVLSIDVTDLLIGEGTCRFQVQFETSQGIDNSNTLEIYYTANKNLKYTFEDISAKHTINGVDFYDTANQLKYKISIENFQKYRFVNPTFENGYITGVATKSENIIVEDLFGGATVALDFKLDEEKSDSALIKLLTLQNGSIINNCIVADDTGKYKAEFRVPGSESFNALQIISTDPNFEITSAQLIKAKLSASGSNKATSESSGMLKISNSTYILVLVNVYDPGKDEMKLIIETHRNLDLDKFQFSAINL